MPPSCSGVFGKKRVTASSRVRSAVDLHAALREALDVRIPLDGDERAELAIGEVECHLGEEFERLARAGGGGEEAIAAERGEGAAEFRLEDHHDRQHEKG